MVRAMLYPPSHADLVDKALHYLKQVHPNCYRTMTDAERQQYSEDSAKESGTIRTDFNQSGSV